MFLLADTPVGPLPLPMPVPMDAGLGWVIGPIFTFLMMVVSGWFTLRNNTTVAELRIELATTKAANAQAVSDLATNRAELVKMREELAKVIAELQISETDRKDLRRQLEFQKTQLLDCQQERAELARLRQLVVDLAAKKVGGQ